MWWNRVELLRCFVSTKSNFVVSVAEDVGTYGNEKMQSIVLWELFSIAQSHAGM
jgi:hypothetical protein